MPGPAHRPLSSSGACRRSAAPSVILFQPERHPEVAGLGCRTSRHADLAGQLGEDRVRLNTTAARVGTIRGMSRLSVSASTPSPGSISKRICRYRRAGEFAAPPARVARVQILDIARRQPFVATARKSPRRERSHRCRALPRAVAVSPGSPICRSHLPNHPHCRHSGRGVSSSGPSSRRNIGGGGVGMMQSTSPTPSITAIRSARLKGVRMQFR